MNTTIPSAPSIFPNDSTEPLLSHTLIGTPTGQTYLDGTPEMKWTVQFNHPGYTRTCGYNPQKGRYEWSL